MDNYHLNEAVQYVRDWRTTSRGIIIVDAQITSSALQKMERDTRYDTHMGTCGGSAGEDLQPRDQDQVNTVGIILQYKIGSLSNVGITTGNNGNNGNNWYHDWKHLK